MPTDDEKLAVTRVIELLSKWLPPKEPFTNPLEKAGYERNIYRIAQTEGLALILAMIQAGVLGPNERPIDRIQDLIARANRAEKRSRRG